MAITFFGSAAVPTDNGTNATATITVTPPASMQVGDLVVVICRQRGTGVWTNGLTGGQTWSDEGNNIGTANVSVNTFWCRFNGTWSVNPRFDNAGATNTSLVMLVFRPTSTSHNWGLEFDNISINAANTLQTITGVTPTNASNVSIASWHTADDNTWGTLTGTNWTVGTLAAQYRNLAGNDGSCTHAYQIQTTALPTNSVSKTQTALGADATTTRLLNFYEFTSSTYDASVTLTSSNLLSNSGGLDFLNSISLNSENNLSDSVLLTLDSNINISSNNTISQSNNIDFNGSISLNQDIYMLGLGNSETQNNISLSQINLLSNINNVEISENLSLQTDSGISDSNLATYLNNTILLTQNNISFTYDEFGELIIDLVSLSGLTIQEQISKLAEIQLQINNDVIFSVLKEINEQLNVISDANILTNDEIISYALSFLDIESELITECGLLFDDNLVNLNLNAFISFVAGTADFTNNEIVNFDSIITNNILLKTLICNLLLENSNINNAFITKQVIENNITFNSDVTNLINLKSIIK